MCAELDAQLLQRELLMALVDEQSLCGAKKPSEKSGYLTEERACLL
jgi:hypothetical protein